MMEDGLNIIPGAVPRSLVWRSRKALTAVCG